VQAGTHALLFFGEEEKVTAIFPAYSRRSMALLKTSGRGEDFS